MWTPHSEHDNTELAILSLPELKRLLVTCTVALTDFVSMPTSVELVAEAYGAMRRLTDAVRAEIERQEQQDTDDNATRRVPPMHD